jgi:putative heme transporter
MASQLASATDAPPTRGGGGGSRSRGGFFKRHRRAIAIGVLIGAIVCFIYFVVPQISGLSATLHRLRNADPVWIVVGIIFETLSIACYAALFRGVFSCHERGIGWRESIQITLAGTVATKLLAAAGAGGVALTVWALRASGLKSRAIARRMLTFELLLYSVFAGAILLLGIGLRTGALSGVAPWTLTVVPAVIAGGVISATVILWALPAGRERMITARAGSSQRVRRLLAHLAAAPQLLREATSVAIELLRERELGIFGAIGYWAFDMATLWAALHAFGQPPPFPAVAMAYFVGQLFNAIPLPGGIGGVEGGTIGALIAFGAQGSLAVLGVLAYRLISFWLPTVPGGVAYLRLRRTVSRWRGMDEAEPDQA